jgi:hypothetical protein
VDSYLPHEKSKYDDSGKASYDKIDSNYEKLRAILKAIDNPTGNPIPPPIKNLSGDGGAIIGNSSNNNSKDAKSLAKLLLVDDDSDIVQVSSTSSPSLLLQWLIM